MDFFNGIKYHHGAPKWWNPSFGPTSKFYVVNAKPRGNTYTPGDDSILCYESETGMTYFRRLEVD